jgi:hypothetical protein
MRGYEEPPGNGPYNAYDRVAKYDEQGIQVKTIPLYAWWSRHPKQPSNPFSPITAIVVAIALMKGGGILGPAELVGLVLLGVVTAVCIAVRGHHAQTQDKR